jgi:histone acetyltransferase
LRKGVIQITPVENDKQPRSLVILTGLKTLFQKQLPNMPREYIARLVYDTNSRGLAIIKRGYKVVGGICFRPFPHRGFAEIVFFATASADQEKVCRPQEPSIVTAHFVQGYGGMLMDHFKTHIKQAYPGMMHFLTYADNYAVGYFEKQGFTKDITLDRSVWAAYIKDYEGGTIMQCTMLRKVDYLDKANIITQQQEAVMAKIRQMSKSHIVYPGLPQFQPGALVDITVNPKDVPGLRKCTSITSTFKSVLNICDSCR